MEAVVGLLLLLDPGCDVGDEVLHSAAEAETARSASDAAPIVERRDRHTDQFSEFFGRDHVGNERTLTGRGREASVGGIEHGKSLKIDNRWNSNSVMGTLYAD